MGVMRHATVGVDSSLGLIAERLRSDSEHLTHEALPAQWVDLIYHLNAQERMLAARAAALDEVLRTEEPTPEATAKLEELRRKAARANGEGDQGSS